MYVISVQNTCNNSRVHRCETVIRLYALCFPLALHYCFSIIFENRCYGGILKIWEYRIMCKFGHASRVGVIPGFLVRMGTVAAILFVARLFAL